MKEIVVTTQAELTALPKSFEEFTKIILNPTSRTFFVVEARGNSSVEAWENSVVRVFSKYPRKVVLYGFAVAFVPATTTIAIEKKSDYAHIQTVKDLGWFENNGVEKTDTLILFKRVSHDWKTQEKKPNETLWQIGTTLEHPKWNPAKEECGEGKFHACSRPYFCDEFRSIPTDRYIAISVPLADVYEWSEPEYKHKIAFRTGTVLYRCDRFGKEVK